jgi:uncharacterized protein (DUF4415 family)
MKMARDDIRRYSLDELREKRAAGRTTTRADAPRRQVDEDFWRTAKVIMPPNKASVHLRVDTDVLEWFKAQGRGHLTRMNAVLRSYMEAHRHGSSGQ